MRVLGGMSMNTSRYSGDTPAIIAAILGTPATMWLARIGLTLPYWWSGIDKLLHPQAALAEMHATGLPASWLLYALILIVQLGGSLTIICNRYAWLGAGALAVFTALATYLAHAFWKLDGAARFAEMNVFMEHIALIAGMAFAALYSYATKRRDA
ncbi:DoxX family protein [Dyella sp. S184]|uniref:DoxX family protein n=1 Tax=Dyella sp. S184 TaxID=1641862 RepID=UPI001C203E3B|nr:DoxX family protein [Dyella sp. S184]